MPTPIKPSAPKSPQFYERLARELEDQRSTLEMQSFDSTRQLIIMQIAREQSMTATSVRIKLNQKDPMIVSCYQTATNDMIKSLKDTLLDHE